MGEALGSLGQAIAPTAAQKSAVALEALDGHLAHQHMESTPLTFMDFLQLLRGTTRLCEV